MSSDTYNQSELEDRLFERTVEIFEEMDKPCPHGLGDFHDSDKPCTMTFKRNCETCVDEIKEKYGVKKKWS